MGEQERDSAADIATARTLCAAEIDPAEVAALMGKTVAWIYTALDLRTGTSLQPVAPVKATRKRRKQRRSNFREAERQEVARLYATSARLATIAAQFDTTEGRVCEIAMEMGVPPRSHGNRWK